MINNSWICHLTVSNLVVFSLREAAQNVPSRHLFIIELMAKRHYYKHKNPQKNIKKYSPLSCNKYSITPLPLFHVRCHENVPISMSLINITHSMINIINIIIISSWSQETELIIEHEISVTLKYCHRSQTPWFRKLKRKKKYLLTLFILALDPLQFIIKTYNNVL